MVKILVEGRENDIEKMRLKRKLKPHLAVLRHEEEALIIDQDGYLLLNEGKVWKARKVKVV